MGLAWGGGAVPNFSNGGTTLIVWIGLVRAANNYEVTSNDVDERLARMSLFTICPSARVNQA